MEHLSGGHGKGGQGHMKRILIDLTDLELWDGIHGGTQRVVYGIAKNFYLQSSSLDYEMQFVAFSGADKSFHVTSFESIYQRVESSKVAQATPTQHTGLSNKVRLKQALRPYVPESVRKNPKLRKAALRSARAALKTSRHVKSTAKRLNSKQALARTENIIFQADDVVLVLGKPWDDLNIQRVLSREKSRVGFKLVELVYDQIITLYPQLHHPDLFEPYTQHMFEAVAASDLLLSISGSTANDTKLFSKKLNLACPDIKTIRLGDTIDVPDNPGAKPDPRINDKYIACVGTIEIRKNHSLLYYAYKLAEERGIELPQLVIVGSRGWLTGDFQYLVEHDTALKDKIIILDSVSDEALDWIYENCLFTVYPSFYEGWGLPVAESLAHGKPCVASNASSIPEIGGGLVDYFSPYSASECLESITKYLSESTLSKKQKEIKESYKLTTWEQTFNQVLKALR
jgi:glycosyltransferase involved in cell wall biosynthesis